MVYKGNNFIFKILITVDLKVQINLNISPIKISITLILNIDVTHPFNFNPVLSTNCIPKDGSKTINGDR